MLGTYSIIVLLALWGLMASRGRCARVLGRLVNTLNKRGPAMSVHRTWPARPTRGAGGMMRSGITGGMLAFVILMLFLAPASWAVPPGTVINNRALASYTVPGVGIANTLSNLETVTTVDVTTVATFSVLEYLTGSPLYDIRQVEFLNSSASYEPFAQLPTVAGSTTPIDISAQVPLAPAGILHMGDAVFISIDDNDQNTDPLGLDSILVTVTTSSGDTEVIRLYETGVNTGVFGGYVQTADADYAPVAPNDGLASIFAGATLVVEYIDNGLPVSLTFTADPVGLVFDSRTGALLNGATITIYDASTNQPALVNGDDGLSSFPSSIVTGGTLTDSSGKTYNFGQGEFRFPIVAAGSYYISVTPLAGYVFPSIVSDIVLQALPGAPFALTPASRGGTFAMSEGGLLLDIPLDPQAGALYVTKKADRKRAAIGDHLLYTLTAEETAGTTVFNTVLTDKLPAGFVYMKGSARFDGLSVPDPLISPDRRTLEFSLGDMAPGAFLELRFVVEVAAGAKPGPAVNRAFASSDYGGQSNTAKAEVEVYEDLFRSKAIIMGRVVSDACGYNPEVKTEGVKGVRVYMEDGSYVVSDENGMFHFKGVDPGAHVLQLDELSLPPQYKPVLCGDSTQQAGSATSRFVDLQGGSMWRAEFHLDLKPRDKGQLSLSFDSSITNAGDIEYTVPLNAGRVPLGNVSVTVILPPEVRYRLGTATFEGEAIPDPADMDGALVFRLGGIDADTSPVLRFGAMTLDQGDSGKFVSKLMVGFDTPVKRNLRTPVLDNVILRSLDESAMSTSFVVSAQFEPMSAELTEEDMEKLDNLIETLDGLNVQHLFTYGHTDSLPLTAKARRKYKSNYELSRRRAWSVARYLGQALELSTKKISFVGHGPDKPVADNFTQEGRSMNRRVEIKVFYEKIERKFSLSSERGQSGIANVETIGLRGGQVVDEYDSIMENAYEPSTPAFDELWMRGVEEGLEMVWPPMGYHPRIPNLTMAIKHKPGTELRILLNGSAVNPVYREFAKVNEARTKSVTLYKGVPLDDGPNEFMVEERVNGDTLRSTVRTIHYSSEPVAAELVPEKSRLVADGKTSPVLAVRLMDKYGHPVRAGMMGEYSVSSPYLPAKREQGELGSMLVGHVRYRVGMDGIAYIRLAPTATSGEAVLSFMTRIGNKEVRAWLSPDARDWILVGFAEGTTGHNTLKGNMESLLETGYEDGSYSDGRVAFFAKGRVKGKWLLTAAYDSAKESYDRRRIHSIIDPDKYYTLYGDSTRQGNEASSSRKLYLKIERGQFYALFGDFNTGLTVTSLSRYSRDMNGFKAEQGGERLNYKVFASETSHAFVRDEIEGDGTSGLYRLSRNNIQENSDKVRIEVRDRFRPDIVLETRTLTRYLDYDIDYDEGTLFFKEPVHATDSELNLIYIVIDYESFDSDDTSMNYGGRGAVSMLNGTASLGATVVHEASVGREADLSGLDARVKIGRHTEVKAEYAATENTNTAVPGTSAVEGAAYQVEVAHKGDSVSALAYATEQEPGFGLGQQSASSSGLRRYGFDMAYKAGRNLSLNGRMYRQHNLGSDAERDYGELSGKYSQGSFAYIAGLRSVTDTFSDGRSLTSEQARAGVEWRTLKRKLTLKLMRDQSLSESNANSDYPSTTSLLADYRVSRSASLFAAHEIASGKSIKRETSRAGIKASPWADATVSTSVERQFNENGMRMFSNFGLAQKWRVNEEWAISAGYSSRTTIAEKPASTVTSPSGTVSQDYDAYSLGANYARQGLSWNSRVEQRNAESYDKTGIFTTVSGEPRRGIGLSAGLRSFLTDRKSGQKRADHNIRLGFVRRPFEARWIVLDRLDYILASEKGGALEYDTWRLVNNLNANYMFLEKYQVSLQYGSKYVKDRIDELDYKGYTDLIGVEVRYNINRKWDVGGRYSMLHSYEAARYDQLTQFSVGYLYARNMWVSMGYNYEGFRDKDFSKADFTASGPFVRFKVKFDHMSVKSAVERFTGN